jgi:hypothetical protein
MAWPSGWVDLSPRLQFNLSVVCQRNSGGSLGEWAWDFCEPSVPLFWATNFAAAWEVMERDPSAVRKVRIRQSGGEISRIDLAFLGDKIRALPYLFLLGGNERLAIAKILKESSPGKWAASQVGKDPVFVWAARDSGAAKVMEGIARKDPKRWTPAWVSPRWKGCVGSRWTVSETRNPGAMVRPGKVEAE